MAFDVFWEPLIELLMGVKQGGHDEMKKGPELRMEYLSSSLVVVLVAVA